MFSAEKEFTLTREEKDLLLKISRKTLVSHIQQDTIPEFKVPDPVLKQPAGVFVTLNKDHDLRGCIGYILPVKPLYEAVIENTVNSSSHDYRFSPVTPGELDKITIEISVLSPPVPVKSPKDIILGKHGIILKKGRHQAVFLPQVAPEQGWDLETTLRHLSAKAGLAPDDWKTASFEVFTAIVFHEN